MWLNPNFGGILLELKALPNWVLTKAIIRDGEPTKVPYQPNGRLVSVTDPNTWSKFEAVKAAFHAAKYSGVGFVLDGQPHFGGKYLHVFDWDDCISEKYLDPAVKAIVNSLGISRLEISISGTGLRGFFLHDTLLPSRKTTIEDRSVELYSDKRYMTTTGRAFQGWECLS